VGKFIVRPVCGLTEHIAVAYIALALLMLVNMVIQIDTIYDMIEGARFSRGLYANNLFLNFVLNRVKIN